MIDIDRHLVISQSELGKVVLFTHIDLDGIGCEILFKSCIPHIQVYRVNYDFDEDIEYLKIMKNANIIFISDISISPDTYHTLILLGKIVIMLDHHKSAEDKYNEFYSGRTDKSIPTKYLIDTTKSGTLLTYEFLLQNLFFSNHTGFQIENLKILSDLINDYDLWKFEYSQSKDMQFLWNSIGSDKFLDKFINGDRNPIDNLSDEDRELIQNNRNRLSESIKSCKDTYKIHKDIDGYTFAIVNPKGLISLAVAEFIKDMDNVDYAVAINSYGPSLSIRSRKIPINHIAESLNGGGHKLASGCPYPTMMDIAKSVANRKVIYKFNLDKFQKGSEV